MVTAKKDIELIECGQTLSGRVCVLCVLHVYVSIEPQWLQLCPLKLFRGCIKTLNKDTTGYFCSFNALWMGACLDVALGWPGDLSSVSLCLCPIKAGTVSSRHPWPGAQEQAAIENGWIHTFMGGSHCTQSVVTKYFVGSVTSVLLSHKGNAQLVSQRRCGMKSYKTTTTKQ